MIGDDTSSTTRVRTLTLSPQPVVWLWITGTGAFLVAFPGIQDLVSALLPGGDATRLTDPAEWLAHLVLWLLAASLAPAWAVGRHRFACGKLSLASEYFDVEQVGLHDPIRICWSDVGEFRLGDTARLRSRVFAINAYTDHAPAGRPAISLRVPVTVKGMSRNSVVDLLNDCRRAAMDGSR